MTQKIRRREIKIETHELTVIRWLSTHDAEYCQRCETQVVGFTLDQAAAFLYKNAIKASIDRGHFHLLSETLVCSNSLASKTKLLK